MNVLATIGPASSAPQSAEHFDVLIVGAGISGIGSAHSLTTQLPGRSFVIPEAQETFGGSWLARPFPAIRSDSERRTFGYTFKPWVWPPNGTSEEIKSCM